MPVHTEVDTATGRGTLTFVLADNRHDAPISVVGSLNPDAPRSLVMACSDLEVGLVPGGRGRVADLFGVSTDVSGRA